MGEPNQLQSFAEDLAVFRQLTASAERAALTALMKRAYARQMSACTFVQRSPERRVSARLRALCDAASSRISTPGTRDAPHDSGGEGEDDTILGLWRGRGRHNSWPIMLVARIVKAWELGYTICGCGRTCRCSAMTRLTRRTGDAVSPSRSTVFSAVCEC
jgi:hypothetical protein